MKEFVVWTRFQGFPLLQGIYPDEAPAMGEVARHKLVDNVEALLTIHEINYQQKGYDRWKKCGLGQFSSRSLFQVRQPEILLSFNSLCPQTAASKSSRPLAVLKSGFWWNQLVARELTVERLEMLCRGSRTFTTNAQTQASAMADSLLNSLLTSYGGPTSFQLATQAKSRAFRSKAHTFGASAENSADDRGISLSINYYIDEGETNGL